VVQPIVLDGPVYLAQADAAPGVVAPPETPTEQDVPGLVKLLAQAVKDKDWELVIAFVLMLLVAIGNFILIKLDVLGEERRKLALPWIASISATLVLSASTLIAGGGWWQAILAGLVTGAAATGLWELIFKHVVKLFAKPAAPSP
jgi:glucose-6-phosphate-specific signal transduction histidine kinase